MKRTNYEIITPSPIENCTVSKMLLDGVHKAFMIAPNEGYVLHDTTHDVVDIDPNTMVQSKKLGYTEGYVTCGASYDFTPITIADENGVVFTAYGEREFAARMEADI